MKIYDLLRHPHLWVGVWVVGWMGGSVGQWVVSGDITKYQIELEVIEIIQFCLKIYDLWRHPHLWVDGWANGRAHVKSLNQINLDLIEIIQLWTFWTFFGHFT